MTNLEALLNKFAESGARVFKRAIEESHKRQQNYVSLGHVLKALAVEYPDSFGQEIDRIQVLYPSEIEPKFSRREDCRGDDCKQPATCWEGCQACSSGSQVLPAGVEAGAC